MRRGDGIQPLEYFAGAREAADPVQGGGHVATVVDLFVDVGERGGGVVEEHRAEPADRHVEALCRKAEGLRIGVLEGDVAEPLSPGELAGAPDRRRGDVDAERTSCPGRARGLPGRLPGPTAD